MFYREWLRLLKGSRHTDSPYTQPNSRQPVERVKATLRHAQARAPAVRLSYSVVKSFPALPIQQSKAVTIALSTW